MYFAFGKNYILPAFYEEGEMTCISNYDNNFVLKKYANERHSKSNYA